ncbi:MAG: 4-hydroxy-tetrahydrodipicolinate reductase [Acidimicrobiales bacterium]
MTIRVGVLGARGRMGATVCDAVTNDEDLELVAALDFDDDLSGLQRTGAEVVVDFTVADAARHNLPILAGWGMHAVVGTTGLHAEDLTSLRGAFTKSNCVVAANFAIGAVLMMRFAEVAAPYFDSVEVIELHHDNKVDAPSGTATETVRRMAEASQTWAPDPTQTEILPGARGGVGPAGIHVHSVRLRGLVAHQEVLFGTAGQQLTIRHDSFDRVSFMPGVLLAAKRIGDHPGLTIGLEPLLGL